MTIELARRAPGNPALPDDLEPSYRVALQDLARKACGELGDATDPVHVSQLLAAVALAKGLRATASLVSRYGDDELGPALEHMQGA